MDEGKPADNDLADTALPVAYSIAWHTSERARRHFEQSSAVLLCLLAAAALLGSFTLKIRQFDVAAFAALAAFLIAFVLQTEILVKRPNEVAERGRRVASEIKSLAWLYAVGGLPFARSVPEHEARQNLVRSVRRAVAQLDNAELSLRAESQDHVTIEMGRLRSSSLSARKVAYEDRRIKEEANGYAESYIVSDRMLRILFAALMISQVFALLLTTLKISGKIDWDALGTGATVVAAITAWVQLRRYRESRLHAIEMQSRLANVGEIVKSAPLKSEEAWSRLVRMSERSFTGIGNVQPDVLEHGSHRRWTWDEYASAVDQVKHHFFDDAVSRDHRLEPDVVIGVNGGGAIVGGMLFLITRSFEFVPISFRMHDTAPAVEAIRTLRTVVPRYADQPLRILVVDSVSKKGTALKKTMQLIKDELGDMEHDCRTAVLVYRPPSTGIGDENPVTPDFYVSTEIDYFPYGPI